MRAFALGIVLLLCGCASHPLEKLPTVPWRSTDDALRILRDRAAAIHTLTATGDITLSRPDGNSVRMDLAMVSRRPDHLRLRAWKLGRAVFDLTLTPAGLWMLTPEDPSMRQKARQGGMSAARLARSWETLSGGLFARSDLSVKAASNALIIRAPMEDPLAQAGGATVIARIDRRTLVPVSYEIRSPDGARRFSLRLSRYEMIDQIPYPMRCDATSDNGTIRIDLRDVDINTELAPRAFVPPARAEKIQ